MMQNKFLKSKFDFAKYLHSPLFHAAPANFFSHHQPLSDSCQLRLPFSTWHVCFLATIKVPCGPFFISWLFFSCGDRLFSNLSFLFFGIVGEQSLQNFYMIFSLSFYGNLLECLEFFNSLYIYQINVSSYDASFVSFVTSSGIYTFLQRRLSILSIFFVKNIAHYVLDLKGKKATFPFYDFGTIILDVLNSHSLTDLVRRMVCCGHSCILFHDQVCVISGLGAV